MVLLKRFSEFKEFRDLLVNSLTEDDNEIPLLPSKSSMSLTPDVDEELYFQSRQIHLDSWLKEVFARQSYANDQYRDAIYEFASN
jgi:hypothetical protein